MVVDGSPYMFACSQTIRTRKNIAYQESLGIAAEVFDKPKPKFKPGFVTGLTVGGGAPLLYNLLTKKKSPPSIIDKDNFKTVATIELAGSNGNYTGEWEAEDIGDYIVEVEATDDDGNKTKDQVEVTVSSTVGVEKVGQNSLDFYLNHENTKLLFKQEGDYMIYDMKGSLAAKGVVSNNSVDINSLKPGLYNVKINNQVGSFVKK